MSGVITYQMVVDQSGAVKSISQVETVLKQSEVAFERNTQAVKRNTKALGEQERTANLAGMAALELSRTISDSAYGIRGMANNIGQLVTIFAMMSVQVNPATGAVLGLAGAIRATWRAMMGPMGIVFAIQGLLSLLTLWESGTDKQKDAQKGLNDELEKTKRLTRDYTGDLESLFYTLRHSTGETAKLAERDIKKIVKRFDELRNLGWSYEDIQNKAVEYQRTLERERVASEELSELRKTLTDGDLEIIIAQDELNKQTLKRYQLEKLLMGIEEERSKKAKQRKKDPYQLIPAPDIDLTKKKHEWEQLVEFINRRPMFGNEALADVKVFAQHLDAISGTMFAMGNTFGNVAAIIDDGSEEMEERLKTIYEIQQGFAIASITVDTLVAMSKVTAETPFLAFLKNAQILAQGVAGVTAVLAQKPGRSSQLRGVKNSSIGTAQDDTVPVTTTGFSNLAGGEKPNQDIRVYVMGSDIRSVQDRSTRTKVRAKL